MSLLRPGVIKQHKHNCNTFSPSCPTLKLYHCLYTVKLKILEAWDEPHSAAPSGDSPAGSLHYEGRAAVIQLSADNTAANIKTLTQYALCSGADYVKNEGTVKYYETTQRLS